MKLRTCTILVFLLSIYSLTSQTSKTDYEIGGGVQYQLQNHNGKFSKLNEIPNCCPEFKTGDGSGISAMLFYKQPIFRFLDGQIRVSYSSFNALFLSTEATKVSLDNQLVDGEFEHRLEAKFTGIQFQPLLSYSIIDNLNVNIGLNLGILLSGSFYQIEKITKPTDRATYVGDSVNKGKRTWNEAEGKMPNIISLQYGAMAGLSYNVPLNKSKTLWASPEVYYSYGLTNVADKTPWKVNTLSQDYL